MSGYDAAPVTVSLKNINFSFPGTSRPAMSDVSFELLSGNSMALIGPSGAGKTTLANIVMGFLVPDSGEVSINGQLPVDFIAGNPGAIGYVPQFPNLIRGSLAANIALGVPSSQIDEAWLIQVIRISQLQDWFDTLAEGLATEINSKSLSGGQIQRIGIARALYTKPHFLIMDEPTGSLDGQTEKALTQALIAASNGLTTLTIAHRLSTIESSDSVAYLVEGRIRGIGTLEGLRKANEDVEKLAQQFTLYGNQSS